MKSALIAGVALMFVGGCTTLPDGASLQAARARSLQSNVPIVAQIDDVRRLSDDRVAFRVRLWSSSQFETWSSLTDDFAQWQLTDEFGRQVPAQFQAPNLGAGPLTRFTVSYPEAVSIPIIAQLTQDVPARLGATVSVCSCTYYSKDCHPNRFTLPPVPIRSGTKTAEVRTFTMAQREDELCDHDSSQKRSAS